MMLAIFAGPGSRARELDAVHLRIDTIEMAICRSRMRDDCDLEDVGYQVAYGIAADNLRLGDPRHCRFGESGRGDPDRIARRGAGHRGARVRGRDHLLRY